MGSRCGKGDDVWLLSRARLLPRLFACAVLAVSAGKRAQHTHHTAKAKGIGERAMSASVKGDWLALKEKLRHM